jgi:hypothetical protein
MSEIMGHMGGFAVADMPVDDMMGEEDGELSPEDEAIAETLANEFDTALERAEACVELSESAESDEEASTLLNLAKFYAALDAASREMKGAGDDAAFESIIGQLQGTAAYDIAMKVEELEDASESEAEGETLMMGEM